MDSWVGLNTYHQSKADFGMKTYKLCESSTSYVWNFVVYTSKDTIYGQRHTGEQTSLRIVLEVAHDLLDKGQCLYPDNWNTSPKLVGTSCTRKTDVVGTMRTNRKEFPDVMKRARLKKGQTVAALRKKQMIMKWKNKRNVVLISIFHDDSMWNVTTRKGIIQKPSVVLDNKKWGVDRNSQHIS
jgi:hypothetical protein